MKKALITGITGQDGSYLAELLLEKGYEVHGIMRRNYNSNLNRLEFIINNAENDDKFFLYQADFSDPFSLRFVIDKVRPNEIYNLAAMSHVGESCDCGN